MQQAAPVDIRKRRKDGNRRVSGLTVALPNTVVSSVTAATIQGTFRNQQSWATLVKIWIPSRRFRGVRGGWRCGNRCVSVEGKPVHDHLGNCDRIWGSNRAEQSGQYVDRSPTDIDAAAFIVEAKTDDAG
jgi:hypothetical protein